MKTGRRGFLGKMAALVGLAALEPMAGKAEAAEIAEGWQASSNGWTTRELPAPVAVPDTRFAEMRAEAQALWDYGVDDTDLIQGYIDRGEPIPWREQSYRIMRTLTVTSNAAVIGAGPHTPVLAWSDADSESPLMHISGDGAFVSNLSMTRTDGNPLIVVEATNSVLRDIHADAYADGYTQATQRAESRVAEGLPIKAPAVEYHECPCSFEEMQADCADRGCSLTRIVFPGGPRVTFAHSGQHSPMYTADLASLDLTKVDAWRHSLHADPRLTDYLSGGWTPSIGGASTYNVAGGVYTRVPRVLGG